jgi:hypothetical protein
MNKDYVHAKNEILSIATNIYIIFKQVCHVHVGERLKTLVQFSICFHMLIDYESMNKLLHSLDVKKFPKTIGQIQVVRRWHFACVATLALGLRPRQRLARLRANREPQEAHCMLPRVPKSVRE